MGLLPCLRLGESRWWLPLTGDGAGLLAEMMVAGDGDPPVSLRGRVVAQLLSDPPLLIYAALASAIDRVDVVQLADWLIAHATARFANGDSFLGAPTIEESHRKRWRELRDYFLTLPPDRWVGEAELWLEVTGPPVPDSWREQWPVVGVQEGTSETTAATSPPGAAFLPELARRVQHARVLETAFDAELRRAKLEAVKQLAYGLSHEINNPLANISTRAQQLQREETDPSRAAVLQRIVDQVYRAHEMVSDLMFFANPPSPRTERIRLDDIVRGVVSDFEKEARRQSIRLSVDVSGPNAEPEGDPRMIGEAVRALIRNAVEAVGCQGTIAVCVDTSGGAAEIRIADSGPGLSEEARRHAFDPYFSGREAGRGLGLGLCRAYRIARLHHGAVSLSGGPAGCVATLTLGQTGTGQGGERPADR